MEVFMKTRDLLVGWLGAQLLAFCGLPAVIEAVKIGNANGYNMGFLLMWFFGELFTLYYILQLEEFSMPLIFNYSLNLILITILIGYKL